MAKGREKKRPGHKTGGTEVQRVMGHLHDVLRAQYPTEGISDRSILVFTGVEESGRFVHYLSAFGRDETLELLRLLVKQMTAEQEAERTAADA